MKHRLNYTRNPKPIHGFTLIELLVVISIIAVLMSIMIPALSRARDAARVVICNANTSQISLLVATYRASNNDTVPVLLNRYVSFPAWGIPAKNLYTSLALIDYWGYPANLPSDMDITQSWNHQQNPYLRYSAEFLPKFFACPYSREVTMAPGEQYSRTDFPFQIRGESDAFAHFQYIGRTDSYAAWPSTSARNNPNNAIGAYHPLAERSFPKYGAVPWHRAEQLRVNLSAWGSDPTVGQRLLNNPMRWDRSDFGRARSSSPSDTMVLYCARGEFLGTSQGTGTAHDWLGVYNYNSHRKGGSGGTHVIFADGSTQWVKGTQIHN